MIYKCLQVDDIAKTTALLHMILHASLPTMLSAFINNSIPDLLQKTVKQTLLMEPRCQAVCQLIVWTLVAFMLKGDLYSYVICGMGIVTSQ